ncbi:MAG: ATP-binding protein [Planctomycetota bacterium]
MAYPMDVTPSGRSEARRRLVELLQSGGGAGDPRPADPGGDLPSLERLLEISQAMNRIHDRRALLAGLADWLRELFDAENSAVVLFRPDGSPEVLSCHTKEPVEGELPISETILERVRSSREPLLIDDTAGEPDLRHQSSIERFRIASVLCAPLVVGEEVIGALQFDHRGEVHPFSASDRRLLALFAGQAATALHNLQLIEELDQANRETQAAQARLVKAERLSAVGEMAAGIAHNFNNTLFVALGFCDVMLVQKDLDADTRRAVERIRTCALDAANTVRRLQVLTEGRASNEPRILLDAAKEVGALVEMLEPRCRELAGRRGVRIQVATDLGPTPPVSATESDLREIVTNLLFNAVDAMAKDGTITVSTTAGPDQVEIAVADQGIGMDEAKKKRIFEPFFTTKATVGSGLGLCTSWSIARQLGGRILVRSEPGAGSTFTLVLPIVGKPDPAPARGGNPEPRPARILLIDDDPQVLETLRILVELMGYEVADFRMAEEALVRVDESEFDLVITDLSMPGVSGADVIERLRRRHPDLPVVVLTGLGGPAPVSQRAAGSIRAVLRKPITLEVLRSSIAQVLAVN